ncbi:Aldo-keto reductase yakc [NADP(+)] [Vanrija pseudolonga]|uniref:Aldo-keto reductase yakc [NADP(+)] n=1 Tax=Vanrija pseudolonga TaxID=143232 RepID=A0AAF1BQ45_9TREE|nr:Aldo-keto reductase yakc [NADP(+)] [Vanrija pseudolonga]
MPATLKFQDITVPVPGFGAMGFSQSYGPADDTVSKKTLAHAIDIGCTFWDTAVVYGKGHNETLIGEVLRDLKARDKVFVASKCGFDCIGSSEKLGTVTNKPAHIAEYIEGSKQRLGFYPDLYYLHRIDPSTPLEDSIPALNKLKTDGKVKYIGLSECSAATLRKACAIAHIDALQIEYSPWHTDHEDNGLIDAARELGVTIIAYSPLGKGILSGQYRSLDDFPADDIRRTIPRFHGDNFAKNLRIVDEFARLASKKGCTPSQLALAWVVAQGAIPIPGTKTEGRLDENFGARNVELNEAELKELRVLIDTAKPVGNRYSDAHMAMVGK